MTIFDKLAPPMDPSEASRQLLDLNAALSSQDDAGQALLSTLLNNLAACYLQKNSAAIALQLALAAFVTSGGTAHKALARAGTAASTLGDPFAADYCASEAARLSAGEPSRSGSTATTGAVKAGQTPAKKLGRPGSLEDLAIASVGGAGPATTPVGIGGGGGAQKASESAAPVPAPAPEHADADALAAASSLKERGNTSFRAGNLPEAEAQYRAALARLTEPITALRPRLLSRARCRLSLTRSAASSVSPTLGLAEAILDATAVLVLGDTAGTTTTTLEAHKLRIAGLVRLGAVPEALVACGGGAASSPEIKEAEAALLALGLSAEDRDLMRMVQQQRADVKAENSSVEQVAMVNRMAQLALAQGPRAHIAQPGKPSAAQLQPDPRIPPFHEEFKAACGSVCRPEAFSYLWSGYENGRAATLRPDIYFQVSWRNLPPKQDIAKRLSGPENRVTEAAWRWYSEAPFGDVRLRTVNQFYPPFMHHSMSNALNKKEILFHGTTHVAIGFVDLGHLRGSVELLRPHPDTDSTSAPLRWVGYEASVYCVAKSLVVQHMIESERTETTDDVLEVWYSSSWSFAALTAFHGSVTALLEMSLTTKGAGSGRLQFPALQDPRVVALLRAWARAAPIPLDAARDRWLNMRDRSCTPIGNFKVKADRVALARYFVTGELPIPGRAPAVGSIVMHCIPESVGMLEEESVFNLLDADDLFGARLQGKQPDIVQAAAHVLRTQIRALVKCVRCGHVAIELHLAPVVPGSAAVKAIRALEPYSISWSNVSDYIVPRDFLDLARACSGPDTLHMAYSMNWMKEVKGAFSLDYFGDAEFPKRMCGVASECIEEGLRAKGWDGLLLCPPTDNAMNLADWALCMSKKSKWLETFLAAAGPGPKPRVADSIMSAYEYLGRSNGNLYFTFTFSQTMTFKPALNL